MSFLGTGIDVKGRTEAGVRDDKSLVTKCTNKANVELRIRRLLNVCYDCITIGAITKGVLRYIRSTLGARLVFRRNGDCKPIQGYIDADWAGDVANG